MINTLTVAFFGLPWLDPRTFLERLGPYVLIGLCLIVFAECGLLIGFFLPGDSLLFVAGLFVANRFVAAPLWLVCLLLTLCAVAGNVVGYLVGRRFGPALFRKPRSRLFAPEHVDRTHKFFVRFGPRAVVLARFVPIVRTFITAMAGVGQMNVRTYLVYSTVGGVAWATGVTLLGYFLGGIAFVADHVEAILAGIVMLSIVPILVEVMRGRRREVTDPMRDRPH